MASATQSLKKRKAFTEKQAVSKIATDARTKHFDSVAQSLGFANAQIAFNSMGKEFIAIARVGAPSITKAEKEVSK